METNEEQTGNGRIFLERLRGLNVKKNVFIVKKKFRKKVL